LRTAQAATSASATAAQPAGTFTNCTGGEYSFAFAGTASGTFTDCTGGDYSFGSFGTASGTFTNCTGGDGSFGGGTASGTFTNCTGGDGSFGGDAGTASGTFTDCIGGAYSFGGYFGTANGTFTDCIGGAYSFGGDTGTANGTFTDCIGGAYSFGGDTGTPSGVFIGCKLAEGTFTPLSVPPAAANIEGATKTNPVRITAFNHKLQTGDATTITGVGGMTQLNNRTFTVTRINGNEFALNGENGINHSTYTSSGQYSIPANRRIARMINCVDGNGDIIEGEASL
jgi:hypothetical protein